MFAASNIMLTSAQIAQYEHKHDCTLTFLGNDGNLFIYFKIPVGAVIKTTRSGREY